MCLDKIDKKTRTDITRGYKVFRIIDNIILGEYYNPDGTYRREGHPNAYIPYETEKWYETKDYTINEYERDIIYPAGFHTFLHKEDAKAWCDIYGIDETRYKVLKVEVSDIVASGYQYLRGRRKTVVSKRMKIIGGQ